MFLNNEKGETLTEIVVSMTILILIVISISAIIFHSSRVSQNSLNIITETNNEIYSIDNGTIDIPEYFYTSVNLSYKINDNNGNIIATNANYFISDNIKTYITNNGFLFFDME